MNKPVSGVYAIRNTRTLAAYVGSAINIDRRWRLHLSVLKRHRGTRLLQAAWDLDGPAHFTLEILEKLPPVRASLDQAERHWFDLLSAQGVSLNATRYQPRRDLRVGLAVAPRLNAWRVRRALAQHELAELANLNVATVARLEAGGDARSATIRKLAEALQVQPGELMDPPPGPA